ncbi:MAG TPA: hypothetical protein VG456_11470 [Candidatus Sulfopaludibacter sp.]|nr:hypothetical protein [Candidatus Sulfopaludibacter sp.]
MIGSVFGQIVLGQFLPNLVGGYADNGVLAGIEILRKLEDLDSNRTFFECPRWTIDRILNDVLKELTASLARAKGAAFQQTIELRPDLLRL